MPIWKLQCSMAGDSTFPRDRVVITPHFNDQGATTDPQNLCDDLADALVTYLGQAREIVVKAYDAQGTVPVYPQGEAVRSVGVAPPSNLPREVALCLSFYSTRNVPRQRGRLYLPIPFLFTSAGVRPTSVIQQKVMDLAPVLGALGGVDVDWCVYSPTSDAAYPVTNFWCDNEWDTVRSRGLRGTSRLEGTTSED